MPSALWQFQAVTNLSHTTGASAYDPNEGIGHSAHMAQSV